MHLDREHVRAGAQDGAAARGLELLRPTGLASADRRRVERDVQVPGAHVRPRDLHPVRVGDEAVVVVHLEDEASRRRRVRDLERLPAEDAEVVPSHVVEHRRVIGIAVADARDPDLPSAIVESDVAHVVASPAIHDEIRTAVEVRIRREEAGGLALDGEAPGLGEAASPHGRPTTRCTRGRSAGRPCCCPWWRDRSPLPEDSPPCAVGGGGKRHGPAGTAGAGGGGTTGAIRCAVGSPLPAERTRMSRWGSGISIPCSARAL